MNLSALTSHAAAAALPPPLEQQRGQPAEPASGETRTGHHQGEDEVSISSAARSSLAGEQSSRRDGEDSSTKQGQSELSSEEREVVRKLQARDREVRAHEQAHKAAAGGLAAGGPSYTYQSGPDGKRYAVGGEVQVKLKEGRTPEETLRLARQVQQAAQAPDSPSSQDRAVAARAAQQATEAQREISSNSSAEGSGEPPTHGLPTDHPNPGSPLPQADPSSSEGARRSLDVRA